MNRFEVDMMNDCKKYKQDIENIVKGNKAISDFTDSAGNKKYFQILNASNKIIKIIDKMNDVHSICENMNDYVDGLNAFFTIADDVLNYFSSYEKISEKILKDIMSPLIKEKMDKINEMIVGTRLYSNQRISYNLEFQKNILIKNIVNFMDEIVDKTWITYMNLSQETVINTTHKIEIKNNEFETYVNNNEKLTEVQHQKFEKILDCRKMNKCLLEHNFQPVRQGSTSHLIYSNGVNSIVVPQHRKLNKGLAYTIQREINSAKKYRA